MMHYKLRFKVSRVVGTSAKLVLFMQSTHTAHSVIITLSP